MIECTAPLTMDLVKQQFQDKEMFFLIDVKNSQLKGKDLLVYIANLELNCELSFDGCSFEEKKEILKSYMDLNTLNTLNSLSINLAVLVLHSVGIDWFEFVDNPALSKEEAQEFLDENRELFDKWNTFLTSTMIYQISSIEFLENEMEVSAKYPHIDDINYIGKNVVNLFSIPGFLNTYYSLPSKFPVYYFKQQFEEHIFKGKSLFHYFLNEENSTYLMLHALIEGKPELEKLNVSSI